VPHARPLFTSTANHTTPTPPPPPFNYISRYVGVVDLQNRKGSVELRRYPANHPFAQLQGSDNIIAFTTARYEKQPLIVRGPGAGADVTAGGIFSDLLRLAAYLGAPS
jgi:aspartokinase/homoserine dehydrogenase 1